MDRARQELILALDFPPLESACELAQRLAAFVCTCKINIHLFAHEGPLTVAKPRELGPDIFRDLKFHDNPNTAAEARGKPYC